MLSEEELQKKWESLTFTDNFIFSHVMHDENICRQVVELILGVRIGKIHYLSAQDEHKTDPDSMRIIMDVFLRDENRIVTVEMQTGHKKELPRRSRYYQSVADVSTTPSSSQYPKLPDNILIFICTFDPFDRNFPRYTFQYTCQEADHQLKLELLIILCLHLLIRSMSRYPVYSVLASTKTNFLSIALMSSMLIPSRI